MVATVQFGLVQRPYSLDPEPDPGPVRAEGLNPEPLCGLVWFGSG